MKKIKFISSVLFTALLSVVLSSFSGIDPVVLFAGISVAAFVIHKTLPQGGYAFMAVQKEVWLNDIIEALFPDNSFAVKSVDHTPFVINGKTVHVPVAGSASSVVRNRSTFPATASERTDTVLDYNLDSFTTDPTRVRNLEEWESSYEKRNSVMGTNTRQLISKCMTGLLYNWASTTYVHRTTGSTVDANLSGATGQRKAFHKDDLSVVKKAMDAADINPDGRIALLNSHHYNELLESFTDAERTGFNAMADFKKGIVGQYLGFNIMMRSFVARYRGDDDSEVRVDTLASDYAAAAADRKGSLVWQQDSVARADGQLEMYENIGDALNYGNIYSFEKRLGGRIIRTEGVHAIVDAVV